jgi:hypothetical protein
MRPSSASKLIAPALILGASVSAVTLSLFYGLSFSSAAAALCGALCLFSFTESGRISSPLRQHPLVSGKLSRAAIIAVSVFVLTGSFGFYSIALTGSAFIFFETLLFFLLRPREMLFPGIVSHAVLAIIAYFLINRAGISADGFFSFFSGKAVNADPVIASIGFILTLLFLLILPKLSRRLSPVSYQTTPAVYKASRFALLFVTEISIYTAFLFSGILLIPFDLYKGESPVLSRITNFAMYLATAFVSSALVQEGYTLALIAAAAAVSYFRFILLLRRKSGNAEHQRHFIFRQRYGRT